MSTQKKGKLVVISGFSGSGKGTVMGKLMEVHKEDYALSVSATTRKPREGEVDGVHYFFVTHDRFEEMIAEDAFLEYASYVGNYYGTPKNYVMEQLETGKSVILEIEIQGALKVREKFPEAVLLFVTAPGADALRSRLIGRGTESAEVIAQRLQRACEESQGMEEYDYLVVNDEIEACTERIHLMIQNECYGKKENNSMFAVNANMDFVDRMREELRGFSKGE